MDIPQGQGYIEVGSVCYSEVKIFHTERLSGFVYCIEERKMASTVARPGGGTRPQNGIGGGKGVTGGQGGGKNTGGCKTGGPGQGLGGGKGKGTGRKG